MVSAATMCEVLDATSANYKAALTTGCAERARCASSLWTHHALVIVEDGQPRDLELYQHLQRCRTEMQRYQRRQPHSRTA